MLSVLRTVAKNLPTLLLSLILAMTVWISAVSSADPTIERAYPRPIPIEVIGQDPGLLLTSEIPQEVTLNLSAPQTIWNDRLLTDPTLVRALVDLSGLDAGEHTVTVQVQVGVNPHRIVSYTPRQVTVNLEAVASQSFPIRLIQRGELAVGYQAETPVLSQRTASVTGPQSLVNQVQEVRAVLDLNRAQESIERQVNLQAVDASENLVTGVNIDPDQVRVSMQVTQRGGYRNVVVKVVVNGQVAPGYRVTNISVFPPAVTVFSSDPSLVDNLPGYVETSALDLNGAKDDLDVSLPLSLPSGVSVVGAEGAIGDQFVQVQVSVAAIEGSVTIEGMRVEVVGLDEGLRANVSPETVTVILSGPLPMLDQMVAGSIRVVVDVTGEGAGTYQLMPRVELVNGELQVESILPSTLEVTLVPATRFTPQPTAVVTLEIIGTGTPPAPTPTP